MEVCNPLISDPPQAHLTILGPILFVLVILFYYLEAQLMAMAQSPHPEVNSSHNQTKEESHQGQQHNELDDNNSNTKPSEEIIVIGLQPRKCSNILDSHLDDIKVPALQPIPPQKRPVFPGTGLTQLKAGCIGLLDDGLEDLMIPVLEPERKAIIVTRIRKDSNTTQPKQRLPQTVPWDGKIRWAMTGCTIFEDDQEELNAYFYRPNVLSRLPVSDLWIFQYGLRYIPAAKETDVYRTVRIEKIPTNVTLNQILPHVTGDIYSASLFNTTPITGYSSAIIVFVHEHEALQFAWASRKGLALGLFVANVVLVPTPTYPMTAEMHRLIFHQGYTRTLVISNLRRSLKEETQRVLKRSAYHNYVQSVEDGHVAGEVYVRFHSIKTAAAGYELFKGHPSFGNCQVSFVRNSAE